MYLQVPARFRRRRIIIRTASVQIIEILPFRQMSKNKTHLPEREYFYIFQLVLVCGFIHVMEIFFFVFPDLKLIFRQDPV